MLKRGPERLDFSRVATDEEDVVLVGPGYDQPAVRVQRVRLCGPWVKGVCYVMVVVMAFAAGLAAGRNYDLIKGDGKPRIEYLTPTGSPTRQVVQPRTANPTVPAPEVDTFVPVEQPTPEVDTFVPVEQPTPEVDTFVPVEQPTPELDTFVPVEQPTKKPSELVQASDTVDLSKFKTVDPYDIADISLKKLKYWKDEYAQFTTSIVNYLSKELPDGTKNQSAWDAIHDPYCEKANEKEIETIGTGVSYKKPKGGTSNVVQELGFDVDQAIGHVSERIALLCEYYKPSDHYCDLSTSISPRPGFVIKGRSELEMGEIEAHKASMRLHAWKFARRIVYKEPIRVGVMGTSVMSGQSNCYNASYGPMLDRALKDMFSPMYVETEVRASGQNGDGATMHAAMSCANEIFNFDDNIDFMHMYWFMTDIQAVQTTEMILRQWMSRANFILPYFHDGNLIFEKFERTNKGVMLPYMKQGYMIANTFPHKDNVFPWFPNERFHWGRRGDGRCHIETRDGFDGIWMQNWHPGPLGNQMYVDRIMFFYAQAIIMALNDIKLALQQHEDLKERYREFPKLNLPPPISYEEGCEDDPECAPEFFKEAFCANGHQPSWNGKYNLTEWVVPDSENPYKDLLNQDGWYFDLLKRKSDLSGCLDKNVEEEKRIPACVNHLDTGYGFRRNTETSSWLTFKVPPLKRGRITFCTVGLKGNKSPYHEVEPMIAKINGTAIDTLKTDDNKLVLVPHAGSQCFTLTKTAPKGKMFYLSVASNAQKAPPINTLLAF